MANEAAATFDHVAQVVPDVKAAVRWYRQSFPDARVIHLDETWAFLDVGGARIAFVQEERHPAHVAWRVAADELERLARAHNQEIRAHRDRSRSIYVEAPGGNWIEFITFPPESPTA